MKLRRLQSCSLGLTPFTLELQAQSIYGFLGLLFLRGESQREGGLTLLALSSSSGQYLEVVGQLKTLLFVSFPTYRQGQGSSYLGGVEQQFRWTGLVSSPLFNRVQYSQSSYIRLSLYLCFLSSSRYVESQMLSMQLGSLQLFLQPQSQGLQVQGKYFSLELFKTLYSKGALVSSRDFRETGGRQSSLSLSYGTFVSQILKGSSSLNSVQALWSGLSLELMGQNLLTGVQLLRGRNYSSNSALFVVESLVLPKFLSPQ